MHLSTLTFSELLGIGGVAAGLAAIIVAVLIARRRPQLVFLQEGNVVVEGDDPDIAVSWRNVQVPNVARTRITTWNAGAKTFDGSSVVRNYPLRYIFPRADRILAVTVLDRSNEENAFDAKATSPSYGTPNAVLLDFDYLDPRQGAVIEVLHTSDRWGAQPAGTVKGLRKPLTERTTTLAAGPLLAITSLLAGVSTTSIVQSQSSQEPATTITISVVATTVLLTLGTFYVRWRSRPPKVLRLSTKVDDTADMNTD